MSTSPQNNIPTQQSKKRVQLKHALFDINFFAKETIAELGEDKGELAQLYLIKILMMMSGATDAEISRSAALSLRGSLSKEAAIDILDYCTDPIRSILYITRPGFLSNSRVEADQESIAAKQDKWRTEKRKARDTLRTFDGHSTDKARKVSETVNTELLNTEDLNTEVNKENCRPPETEVLTLPDDLETPKVRAALKLYSTKYQEKFKVPFDQILLEATAMRYSGRPDDFANDLAGSVGWKNVRDCSHFNAQPRGDPKAKPYDFEVVKILNLCSRYGRAGRERALKELSPRAAAVVKKVGWSKICEAKPTDYGLKTLLAEALAMEP